MTYNFTFLYRPFFLFQFFLSCSVFIALKRERIALYDQFGLVDNIGLSSSMMVNFSSIKYNRHSFRSNGPNRRNNDLHFIKS